MLKYLINYYCFFLPGEQSLYSTYFIILCLFEIDSLFLYDKMNRDIMIMKRNKGRK